MNKTQSMNLWPNRDVLIVCEDTDYYTMIREILRPLKWAVMTDKGCPHIADHSMYCGRRR